MKLKIATIVTMAGLAAPAVAQDTAPEGDAAAGETVFNRCKACHQIVDDSGENGGAKVCHGSGGMSLLRAA